MATLDSKEYFNNVSGVASAVRDENACAPASMEPNQTYISLGYPRVDLITKHPNNIQNITTSFFLTFLKKLNELFRREKGKL